MKIIYNLGKIYDRINNILATITICLVIFMIVTITIDVVGRFFFNSPLVWEAEINENVILFMTFFAAAWVLRQDGHVNVELVTSRLTGRSKKIVILLNCIIGIILCLIVTYYGIRLTYMDAVFGMHKPTALRIPNVYILWVIPLGSLMLTLEFIRKSYMLIQKLKGVGLAEKLIISKETVLEEHIG
jgi:C4-dicarboxylate transporter, DctQ subunit